MRAIWYVRIIVGFVVWCMATIPSAVAGQVHVKDAIVHSTALEGNLLDVSADRAVTIYLPPAYYGSSRRYPVVFFLHGGSYERNTVWERQFRLRTIADALLQQEAIRPMICVMPDAITKYGGTLYTNSPATGNWDDFITQELVRYVDRTYRTLPEAASRGIAGHSAGAFGAMQLAMRHPDVFGAVYSLSAPLGLVDSEGDLLYPEDSLLFRMEAWKPTLQAKSLDDLARGWKGFPLVSIAHFLFAASLSPNPENPPFFVDLPFEEVNGDIRRVESVWNRWVAATPLGMLNRFATNLRQLRGIGFDVGTRDEFDLLASHRAFSAALTEAGISHVFEEYDGRHVDRIAERLETAVLPFFSEVLESRISPYLPRLQSFTPAIVATRVNQPTRLEITAVLDVPTEASESLEQIHLDLSPLGLSPELRLDHVGAGRYTASTTVRPLQTGQYDLPLMMKTVTGDQYFLWNVRLDVYPAGDMSIYSDEPGAGWTVEASKSESDLTSSTYVHTGSFSHAILLKLGAIPGKVTYLFDDPEGIGPFGYRLEFYINGGASSGQDPQIGGKKLSEWGIVPRSDEWTWVSVPVSELKLEEGRLTSIIIFGSVKEPFYLDDMKLVAQGPAGPTAVEASETGIVPSGYLLSQNYPNPFNPETTIQYHLPGAGTVRLLLYNLSGQLVRTLMDGERPAGSYSVVWDGTDDAGRDVASGVYLCRMTAGEYRSVRKMLLTR